MQNVFPVTRIDAQKAWMGDLRIRLANAAD
jgi:hypothetical protein